MPRLILRLLKSLKDTAVHSAESTRPLRPTSRGRKSLHEPIPPAPHFSATGRSRSILLDTINPIIRSRAYVRHKTLPPRVRLHKNQRKRTVSRDGTVEHDRPRFMTADEREWWANPYLRMLSSPLRTCAVTKRTLPIAFLIRMSPRLISSPRLSSEQEQHVLLPDGLEHSKFRNLYSRKGRYIICRRAVLNDTKGVVLYTGQRLHTLAFPATSRYISHLLRVRIIQELEILADRLQTRPHDAQITPLVRRLTRAEFKSLRTNNILPERDAVAVLVVPPLNKDPATKKRPMPDASPMPEAASPSNVPSTPGEVSVLYPVSPVEDLGDLPCSISPAKVPLYNGAYLFPSKTQRAALHGRLLKLLHVERRARYREHGRPEPSDSKAADPLPDDKWERGDQKGSHAFLVMSSADTVKRADTVPLAIALWRLRMWEGKSWETENGTWTSTV